MSLLDFQRTIKILFAVHLKHSSHLPSADVKPMPNGSEQWFREAVPWHRQCIFVPNFSLPPNLTQTKVP
jgi:hypothetical protein